jgi:tRNA/tmRNA/rRNA uracil-C5-methylase (TrmA/RlmC/RlmD family)
MGIHGHVCGFGSFNSSNSHRDAEPRHLSYEAQLFWKREHVQQVGRRCVEAGPAIFSSNEVTFNKLVGQEETCLMVR